VKYSTFTWMVSDTVSINHSPHSEIKRTLLLTDWATVGIIHQVNTVKYQPSVCYSNKAF
jgi:hypothetical protein